MRAVVQRGAFHYPVEDVPIPAPGPGEALIQIEAAGICAGDRVTYQGLAPWGIDVGVIPGHESVGVVVALGDGAGEAMGITLGDRVTAEVQIPRIVEASGLSEDEVRQIIADNTKGKTLGVFGEETVNVLGVNLDIALAMGLVGEISK